MNDSRRLRKTKGESKSQVGCIPKRKAEDLRGEQWGLFKQK